MHSQKGEDARNARRAARRAGCLSVAFSYGLLLLRAHKEARKGKGHRTLVPPYELPKWVHIYVCDDMEYNLRVNGECVNQSIHSLLLLELSRNDRVLINNT